jgi:hypothetical protein
MWKRMSGICFNHDGRVSAYGNCRYFIITFMICLIIVVLCQVKLEYIPVYHLYIVIRNGNIGGRLGLTVIHCYSIMISYISTSFTDIYYSSFP